MKPRIPSAVLAGSVSFVLLACGPVPPMHEELVPRDLIPIGFDQKDCHFLKEEEMPLEEKLAMGDGSSQGLIRMKAHDSDHKPARPFKCHGAAPGEPPPTSGAPEEHCGHHGVLMMCGASSATRG